MLFPLFAFYFLLSLTYSPVAITFPLALLPYNHNRRIRSPDGNPYTAVIGTVGRLNDDYALEAEFLDQTGVGEDPDEEINQFMPAIQGVTLTAPAKQDVVGRLKLPMEQRKLTMPRDNSRLLVQQMTAQQCEPTLSGALKFSHPPGTHDD